MRHELVPLERIEPLRAKAIRSVFPGALGRGWVHGARWQAQAWLRTREGRGELRPLWRSGIELPGGVVQIPYVQLMTRAQIRRAAARRGACVALPSLAAVSLVIWLAWSGRNVLVSLGAAAVLVLLLVLLLARLGPHLRNGCSGLHCRGCKG